MRRLLGILGGDGDLRALTPQPGLANIAPLLGPGPNRGRFGPSAESMVIPPPSPPALDLCAYRIVQEALTNTIKHAGPGRAPRSRCVGRARRSSSRSLTTGGEGGERSTARRAGHGITGMRERVALHSGTLEAGAGARRAGSPYLPVSRWGRGDRGREGRTRSGWGRSDHRIIDAILALLALGSRSS